MIVSLMYKHSITSITLPEKIRGQFTLKAEGGINLYVEGIDEKWYLKSAKKVKIVNPDKQRVNSCEISAMTIYNLKINGSDDKAFVFVEPKTDDRISFQKYLFRNDISISIGRKPNNIITIDNKYVSGSHATLTCKGGKWSITDSSSNGTYLNGIKIEKASLNYGDVLYILGTIIIVGNQMLAINNPDQTVTVDETKLISYIPQQTEEVEEEFDIDSIDNNKFYRSPRFKRDISTAKFKIDSPPQSQVGDDMPVMMTIGPALTMGMASMATGIYGICQPEPNYISVVTSLCMVLGTVMWPIISKKMEKKRKAEKEALRQQKYKEYLTRIKESFDQECKVQKEILIDNSVSIAECEKRITNISRNLWERSYNQNDFLKINVGKGSVLLDAEIDYPERKFEIERDGLEEELLDICETPHMINDVPITVSLFENNITGIVGDRQDTMRFANGLILQLSTLYSYDEVKFVFLYNEEKDEDALSYVKWLPHIWNNDKSFRFLAKNTEDIKNVSAYLNGEIEYRSQLKDKELDDVEPYYIVFAFDKELSLRADFIKNIYDTKENIHFSVVSVFDELKNLPKECSNVIDLKNDKGRIFDKNDTSGNIIEFKPDIYVNGNLDKLSVALSNIQLDLGESEYKLPKMMTFLEMYDVGKIEHLNILSRWKENDPTKTLEAKIGVDTIGDEFNLDLHEKYHGPHGLVAGMTGSGKSEFIMTYILSLAVNYHPNEVAFVLIDYKGGGMAKAFENLPHTAGIITNLDGSAMNRSLISIQSELRRRQAIFAAASKATGISNIDIYKYQKMYREGAVEEPLQHLFIISDEFAELKAQQPEFMTQLVSAARIGRSLGVHLILATQKPSGVVDDQIWSNAKFKACLKVQDKADSMDMLKRPEAAEIQETGRFYLQVGYNELFKMGQSAWSGAPYYPSDRIEKQLDDSVDIIDNVGHVISSVKIDRKKSINKPKKQIDAITEYISDIAQQENIKIRPLWLDPIPACIYVNDLKKKYDYVKEENVINPVIGEYDDPMNQRQGLLTLPVSDSGNVAIYGMAGSGKTTFITTLIYSLIDTYTPEEVNLYIMDFASETLTAFSKAPHVGDVVLAHEQEKVANLIKLLLGQVQTRKKMFADFGGDIVSYNMNSGKKMPSIVVVINNFTAFTEMYEDFENDLLTLTREGTKYGITFVLTGTGISSIRFRMQQNIGQSYILQLTDETDYSAVFGKTDGLVPSKIKGRGLAKLESINEFQTATPFESKNMFVDIMNYSAELKKKYPDYKAKKIPVLPEYVDEEFIEAYVSEKSLNIPVGVETATLDINYYDFGKNYISFIQSYSDEYENFVSTLSNVIANLAKIDTTLFDPRNELVQYQGIKYLATKKDIETGIDDLFSNVLERHNAIKDAEDAGVSIPVYPLEVYMISSLASLKEQLGDEQSEKLGLILEKGSTKLNIRVIVAEESNNVSSYNFEKWFKGNALATDAVWVGNGITEQYYLKISKTTSEMSQDITPEFGFSVKNGKASMVKLIRNGGHNNG